MSHDAGRHDLANQAPPPHTADDVPAEGGARPSFRRRHAFVGVVATRTVGAFADSAMLPFVVLWAHRVVGLSGAVAGLLFLAQALGELAGGLGGGMLADRLGHRRVLLVSTAGMALGYGSLAAIHQPALAVVAFFAAGLFESAFHPTIAALVTDLRAGPDLPHAYGTVRVGANVGSIGGPLVGAIVVLASLSAVFVAAGALLGLALGVIFLAIPPDRDLAGAAHARPLAIALPDTAISGAAMPDAAIPGAAMPDAAISGAPGTGGGTPGTRSGGRSERRPGALGTLLREGRLALLVASGGLLAITFTWWEADGLVLIRRQVPLGATAYGALFALAAAATVAFQIPSIRLARRWSPSRLVGAGALVQAVGLAALAAASAGYGVLIVAVLVIAGGQMLFAPTMSTYVSRLAGSGRHATYQAALSTTQDIGGAIGPTTGLALGGIGTPRLVWLLAGPLCLLAGLGGARATARPPDGQR